MGVGDSHRSRPAEVSGAHTAGGWHIREAAGGSVVNLTVTSLVTHTQLISVRGPHSEIQRKVRNLKLPLHQSCRIAFIAKCRKR